MWSPGTTAATSGLALFALGKHGGRELNYSSDIDIVAFFDPQRGALTDPVEATKTYTRIVQRLAALMQDRTERRPTSSAPTCGCGPIRARRRSRSRSMRRWPTTKSRGQNWERAAWIKARACAGDKLVGEAFLAELAPYIWRKHLDFATIADIQAMKRQINVAKIGRARRGSRGTTSSSGAGGIREIEFFTQTQQLIAGGRDKALRVRPTAEALAALAAANWITAKAASELTETYWFLRAVENRLQMRRDEQTHVHARGAGGRRGHRAADGLCRL